MTRLESSHIYEKKLIRILSHCLESYLRFDFIHHCTWFVISSVTFWSKKLNLRNWTMKMYNTHLSNINSLYFSKVLFSAAVRSSYNSWRSDQFSIFSLTQYAATGLCTYYRYYSERFASEFSKLQYSNLTINFLHLSNQWEYLSLLTSVQLVNLARDLSSVRELKDEPLLPHKTCENIWLNFLFICNGSFNFYRSSLFLFERLETRLKFFWWLDSSYRKFFRKWL